MAKKAGTAKNPLVQLLKCGQSVWYDNISRELIDSGELRRMVAEDGLRGVTSNPTIFEKAVTGSAVYKDDIQDLFRKGLSTKDVYETLAIQDIQAAADILRPVYDASAGVDGFVSLEVSPTLAYDTDGTIAEAKRLHKRVDRKNVLIKVPSTPPGLPAIEQLIGAGISINVTLMFSTDHYVNVAAAYLRGLEALEKRGGPLDQVASVASVFVSRVDTAIDKILSANPEAWEYLGKVGIANAKAIYAKFKGSFQRVAVRAFEAEGRAGSATALGEYRRKEPTLQRCAVCRGADWSAHGGYDASRDYGGLSRSCGGRAAPGKGYRACRLVCSANFLSLVSISRRSPKSCRRTA